MSPEPSAPSGAAGEGDGGSVVARVLERLLRVSSVLHPDDLPSEVDAAAQQMGADAAVIYVADLDQRLLRRLARGAPADAPVLDVDGSAAGRAFREVRPISVDEGGATVLWLPLLDSAERIGVLGVTVPGRLDASDPFEVLALLVAELVMAKSGYGDSLELTRRSAPVDAGAEMRWALLPPLNFATPQLTLSGILQPGHEIAGDAFDYGVRGDELSFVVIDAMGHGHEASRIADVAIATYRNQRRKSSSLPDVIRAMDTAVAAAFGRDRFVTAHAAALDLRSGLLRVLNAGHPPPVLFRGGDGPRELECRPCMPVGTGSVPTTEAEHQLEPGDGVLFYSDGVIDARDAHDREYGLERLMRTVAERRADGSVPAEVLRKVIHETLDLQQGEAADDASMLFIEWTQPHVPSTR